MTVEPLRHGLVCVSYRRGLFLRSVERFAVWCGVWCWDDGGEPVPARVDAAIRKAVRT